MAKQKPGTYTTTTIAGVAYMALRDWARKNGFDASGVKHVATVTRRGATTDDDGALHSVNVAGARTSWGRWIIPADTSPDVVPAPTGGAVTRRADGRIKWGIYCTDAESVELSKRFDMVDMRAQRKTRRDARKQRKTDAS